MTNKENQRQRKVYLRAINKWVEVSEAVYYEYYRPIWNHRSREQYHKRCMCPRKLDWICDADCDKCRFHIGDFTVSLDCAVETCDDEQLSYSDILEGNEPEPLDAICRDELVKDLYAVLGKLNNEDFMIATGIMEGKTQREIAKDCGFENNSSVSWRKNRLMEHLREALAELGHENLEC